ncbi:hypothetical protein [Paenibacillus sp. V4I5]|uniref:hypothetical protein n=1 Tax=Paenibacillus sp. V4I5 TaxID=3042306 RepID=UPI0027D844CB|nr:hypothetical protein [Paenibacillus sp. V4I5]
MDHDQGNGVWSDIHCIDIRTEKIHNNGTSGQFMIAPILIWTAKYGSTEVGPVSNIELTRITFENIDNFHSKIQGYDNTSQVSNVAITDLKMNGNFITNASQGLIDISANTSNITFNTTTTNYKYSSANSGKVVLFVLVLPIILIVRKCMKIFWVDFLSVAIREAKCRWRISFAFTLQRRSQVDFLRAGNG